MRKSDGKIHYSHIKHIDQSPMHLRADEDDPRSDSDAFAKGRAFHGLVLQGIIPKFWEGDRRGNKYKDALEANGGEIIITQRMYDDVMRMGESTRKSRLAQDLLCRCPNRETYLEWERDGFDCAGTIDAHGIRTVLELKSCESAQPYRFAKSASWYRYPEQMAWYNTALGAMFLGEGSELFDSYIIACESAKPYAVSCHRVTPLRLIQANDRCSEWLRKYEQCKRLNYWPGWDESVWDIDCEIVSHTDDEDDVELAAREPGQEG